MSPHSLVIPLYDVLFSLTLNISAWREVFGQASGVRQWWSLIATLTNRTSIQLT